MKAKDTRGHFHFSHNYERNYQVSLVVITLWDFQNFNFTFGITFCDILHTNIQAFNKKLQKKLIFCIFLKLQIKMTEITWKCEWPLVSFAFIFSASNWSKFKSKVSFGILRTSRFQNWPCFLNLVTIWQRYCQKQKKEILKTPLYFYPFIYYLGKTSKKKE